MPGRLHVRATKVLHRMDASLYSMGFWDTHGRGATCVCDEQCDTLRGACLARVRSVSHSALDSARIIAPQPCVHFLVCLVMFPSLNEGTMEALLSPGENVLTWRESREPETTGCEGHFASVALADRVRDSTHSIRVRYVSHVSLFWSPGHVSGTRRMRPCLGVRVTLGLLARVIRSQ